MSAKHPIIAVTGSSGAGTSTTSEAFRKMFNMMNINAAWLEGDSFHRFTRPEMDVEIRKAKEQGRHISYFGPQANDFPLLDTFFFVNMVMTAVASSAVTFIHLTRRFPTTKCPDLLLHGRSCRKTPMCYFTKVCTVV